MGKRVWDEELSECRFVMRRIGIECYERSLEKAGIASKQHNIILPLKGCRLSGSRVDHTLFRQVFNHENICQITVGIQLVTLALCY